MHILLIAGGWSNEREVSLAGASSIRQALDELGHRVTVVDPADNLHQLIELAKSSDFAFVNLHGAPGEDGLIQAVLDAVGCPYQGSGPAGSMLALNKAMAKELFTLAGIPTPRWEFLPLPPGEQWVCGLDFPLFVKPNQGGSSLGMSMARDKAELDRAMSKIFASGQEVLLEELIQGQELTCAVLGEEALPPILIRPPESAPYFDYHAKYTPRACEEICPAPVDPGLVRKIRELSLRAHSCLGLKGYSRADFMCSKNTPFILEVNTLPGMTKTSLLPLAGRTAGYSFPELVSRLIQLGMDS